MKPVGGTPARIAAPHAVLHTAPVAVPAPSSRQPAGRASSRHARRNAATDAVVPSTAKTASWPAGGSHGATATSSSPAASA